MGPVKTVLVVDDESAILEQVQSFLADSKFEIITVHNSREAIAHLEEKPVDLLLIDTPMPTRSTTALYLMNLQSISSGSIEDFLEKPFTKEQLISFLNKQE